MKLNSSISIIIVLIIYLVSPIISKSTINQIKIDGFDNKFLNITNNNSNNNNNNKQFKQDYDYQFLIKHLTTKTPYNINYNNINQIKSKNSLNQPECKLISTDIVVRHGSRYPELKILNRMDKLMNDLSMIKDNIVGHDWLLNYTIPYKKELAGNLLIEIGGQELYNISKRLLEKYPDYFGQYKPQSYDISSTVVSRTGVSASSFTYGLFEGTGKLHGKFQPVHIKTSSIENDNLLSFFLNCKKYIDNLKNGSISEKEEEIWKQIKYPSIAKEISDRLGLAGKWTPSISNVQSIFLSCVYQVAIDNITDQFCSLLSKDNILDWEYSKDLSEYWVNSYGNQINYEISSLLFQDIFNHFDNIIKNNSSSGGKDYLNNSSSGDSIYNELKDKKEEDMNINKYSKNVFRFGHSETVIPFISLLGLFKDDYHIYANSTVDQIKNRKFRTSELVPYATNIGMYLFDCGGNQGYKILVEHNELPVLIPGCDQYMCSYNKFKSIYPDVLNFNWDSYCNGDNNNSNNNNSSSNK